MTVELVDEVLSFSRDGLLSLYQSVLQSDAQLAAPGAGAGGRGEVWLQPPSRPHGLRSLAQGGRHCRPQGDMTRAANDPSVLTITEKPLLVENGYYFFHI